MGGILFVYGSLATFLVSMLMFRTYMRAASLRFRNYELRLEEEEAKLRQRQEAIQRLLFAVNHKGPKPAAVNLLGLLNLCEFDIKNLSENLALLEKPGHHGFAKIAKRHFDNLIEYLGKIKEVAQAWLDHTKQTTREFEDLQ
jgi:hypothetical protein